MAVAKSDVPIDKLVELALNGVRLLYDQQEKFFIYYMLNGARVKMPRSWAITYSAICLLGLMEAKQSGWDVNWFSAEETMQGLIQSLDVARPGDLGLILWADAKSGGQHSEKLLNLVGLRMQDNFLQERSTTELSWYLTGLCYSQLRRPGDPNIKKLSDQFREKVLANFNRHTGLFSHLCTNGFANIRAQIGNFADQIYSIYGLSVYSQVYESPESEQLALQCARVICQLQGDKGEWWWHYHARQGIVASRYPVFAVHQDGMAPMALYKLSSVSGEDFQAPIQKSLNWLFGNNDIGSDVIDWKQNIIWRDIHRAFPVSLIRYVSYALAQVGLLGLVQRLETVRAKNLNQEMRPYCLAWLLYAFAGHHA